MGVGAPADRALHVGVVYRAAAGLFWVRARLENLLKPKLVGLPALGGLQGRGGVVEWSPPACRNAWM